MVFVTIRRRSVDIIVAMTHDSGESGITNSAEQGNLAGPARDNQRRSLTWVAWLLLILGCGLLTAVVALAFARRDIPLPAISESEPWFSGLFNAAGALSLLATGWFLVLRLPRNKLAWLMLAAGFGYALHLFALGYTYTSYLVAREPLPLTNLMFVLAAVGLAFVLPSLPLVVLLFPSGELPSRRWRFAYWLWIYFVAAFCLAWLSPFGTWVPFENPLGLEGLAGQVIGAISATAWFGFLFLLLAAAFSTLIRGWRATGSEGQQFKWMAVAMALLVASIFVVNLDTLWSYLVNALAIAGVPVAIGIAVVRYRLWDIDVVIRRTTQYAMVTGLLGLIYFGSVIVLQRILDRAFGLSSSNAAIVLSTLLIAALFTPVRRRVQDLIDHRFYRRKYDAEKVLTRFAATVRDETDLDELTAELVRVIQETMQPEHVSIWLRPVSKSVPIDK